MKADVRSRIGREEYLLFFLWLQCRSGKRWLSEQKPLRAVLLRMRGSSFFFLSGYRSDLWVCGLCFFFLFLFLFFTRFLQSAFPASHTRELLHTYHRIPGKERRLGYIWAGLCFSSIDIRLDVYCNDNLCFPELFPKHREMIYFPWQAILVSIEETMLYTIKYLY